MIEIPEDISRDLKNEIKDEFEKKLNEVRESGAVCTADRLEKVCGVLKGEKATWLQDSAKIAVCLHEMVEERGSFEGGFRPVPETAKDYAKAALNYLVDPFDIIPDYEPTMGFIDDAEVLNHALKWLERNHRGLYSQVLRSAGMS